MFCSMASAVVVTLHGGAFATNSPGGNARWRPSSDTSRYGDTMLLLLLLLL